MIFLNKYSHLFQASVNYFSSTSFWIMIFNQKTTVLIIVFAGIAYLFIICLFWRDEGTATSSLPPIKTSGSRHIAENDFEENGDSKGILFWTDFYCNKLFDFITLCGFDGIDFVRDPWTLDLRHVWYERNNILLKDELIA